MVKIFFLQFYEDLSDRQMENYLKDNLAAKYFCEFDLKDTTPDHSTIARIRERIGLELLKKLFDMINDELREHGVIKDTFTFVDSSALKSRIDTWKARDRVAEKGLNNKTVGEDTRDPDARFGCKGKNKVWLGYKKHVAVCMSSRLITGIECTRGM